MSKTKTLTDTGNGLTDGTGVSPLTLKKLVKDFVADALLTIPASLLAIGVLSIPTDQQLQIASLLAIGNSVIKAAYRALLRWATS